MKQFFIN